MDGGSPDACRLPPSTVEPYTPFRTHAVFWLHGRPFATARFVPGMSATPRSRVDRPNVLGFARRFHASVAKGILADKRLGSKPTVQVLRSAGRGEGAQ